MHTSIRITLSAALALSLFSGCAPQPVQQKTITIDSTLPTPLMNGYIADITSAAFEWKPIDDPRVKGYFVYRTLPNSGSEKLERLTKIESRFATHYVDTDLKPNTQYQYRFSTYTDDDHESVAGETLMVATQPMIAPVSFFQSVGNMPRSAKLLWRPHPNLKISGYVLERKNANDNEWKNIANISGRLTPEFIDRDLKDGQVYYYRLRAMTFDNISTDPSEIAKVVTKPLPPEIKNVNATSDLAHAIRLTWDASPVKDLDHYNVYRSIFPGTLFSNVAKLTTTQFSDDINEDGKTYYYKVTAIDKDDLESPEAAVSTQGSTLSKPLTPIAYEGKIQNREVQLKWSSGDPRTVSYVVIKTTKTSWVSREVVEIKDISGTTLTDPDVKPDVQYLYEIVAQDRNGIRSQPTKAIELSYEAK